VKPESQTRLSDVVSLGLVMKVFPPGLVDEVVAECGRREVRRRSLPARVVVYFVIGLALFAAESYEEVFAQLVGGLSWVSRWREKYVLPSSSGLFQARARLGAEPMRVLFQRVAVPLASLTTPGAWLAGRRLVSIDGTTFDVADSDENDAFFGRPGTAKGERAAFPQARLVGLVECGTHAIIDAELGPCSTSEVELARSLVSRLSPGMLCLADRGFYGFRLWAAAAGTGADLLWRMRSSQRLDPTEILPDGSYLAKVYDNVNFKRAGAGLTVRVLDYKLLGPERSDDKYTLITTILDPDVLSAQQLALAYRQRWEIENTLDELKTHQRGPRVVLRSKSPELVQQEIWGHLCCHYAIRTLMWDTADHHTTDPDQVSFITALRIMRRSIAQPTGTDTTHARYQLWQTAKDHLIALINPQRRLRVNPHVIKRKYVKWHVKRARHTTRRPVQPPLPIILQPLT
jgi:Insertion element 4 transposase N-terminal/Transposase DDE domain